jgi:hypothetical protein
MRTFSLFVALIGFCQLLTPLGAVPLPKLNEPPVVTAAVVVQSHQQKLGAALLRKLSIEKLSPADQERCILALGKVHYAPAIPELIRRIDFKYFDPEHPTTWDPWEVSSTQGHPAYYALEDLRPISIPPVVEAILAEQNPTRRMLLVTVLRAVKAPYDDSAKQASIYAQGLAFQREDEDLRREVKLLLEDLSEDNPDISFSPNWRVRGPIARE